MFAHLINSILGGARLCVGRGIEHIITDGDIRIYQMNSDLLFALRGR